MRNKLVLFAVLAWAIMALNVTLLSGFKYDIEILNPEIFLPCPEYPNNYLDSFIKLPENITLLPDDTVHIVGDIVMTHDFTSDKYKFYFDFYKRERGSWQQTIYSIVREDFCSSFFNPKEVWAPYVKNVPAHYRECPMRKGQTVPLDLKTEQGFDLPSPALVGEYWGRCIVGDTNYSNDFCCADFFFNLHRV